MAKATSAAKTATPKGSKKNKKLTLMIIPFVIFLFPIAWLDLCILRLQTAASSSCVTLHSRRCFQPTS